MCGRFGRPRLRYPGGMTITMAADPDRSPDPGKQDPDEEVPAKPDVPSGEPAPEPDEPVPTG